VYNFGVSTVSGTIRIVPPPQFRTEIGKEETELTVEPMSYATVPIALLPDALAEAEHVIDTAEAEFAGKPAAPAVWQLFRSVEPANPKLQ
jgi:hypothetical protein